MVPVLETARLRLRAHTQHDFAGYAAMRSDTTVMRFLGDGHPLSRQEAWYTFLRLAGYWPILGFGFWAIEEKESRSVIGEVGFGKHQRDEEAFLESMPEMGWALLPAAQGRGFATEAARAALEWALGHLSVRSVACTIKAVNVDSLRVAQRCGFREMMRIIRRGHPTVVLTRKLGSECLMSSATCQGSIK